MKDYWETTDHYEIWPDDLPRPQLGAVDMIVHESLMQNMQPSMLYGMRDLYAVLKSRGIPEQIKAGTQPGLSIYGGRYVSSLATTVHRLWKNGMLRRFIRGIYVRSGRPYGVMWMKGDQ